MSDRQGWVGRLGDRVTSTSQQPSSGPEPGHGRPVRSNGPDLTPLPGPGARARQPAPRPQGPARIERLLEGVRTARARGDGSGVLSPEALIGLGSTAA